jgi:hypothetical protein
MCETFKKAVQPPMKILSDSTFSVFLQSQIYGVNFGILKYGNKEVSQTNSAGILKSMELQWINKFPDRKYLHMAAIE